MYEGLLNLRELTEKRIEMFERDPDELGAEIWSVAHEMHQKGWFFVESKTDALLQSIYLFFEREVDVDEFHEKKV